MGAVVSVPAVGDRIEQLDRDIRLHTQAIADHEKKRRHHALETVRGLLAEAEAERAALMEGRALVVERERSL